jgi:hypothetical protein
MLRQNHDTFLDGANFLFGQKAESESAYTTLSGHTFFCIDFPLSFTTCLYWV